jgi:hypothetical protein
LQRWLAEGGYASGWQRLEAATGPDKLHPRLSILQKSDNQAAFRIGFEPGKFDATALRNYVYCAEQV